MNWKWRKEILLGVPSGVLGFSLSSMYVCIKQNIWKLKDAAHVIRSHGDHRRHKITQKSPKVDFIRCHRDHRKLSVQYPEYTLIDCLVLHIIPLYTLLIIPEMWRQLVKYKEAYCLVLNRNKDTFTNWRHASGIINKVYNYYYFNDVMFLIQL